MGLRVPGRMCALGIPSPPPLLEIGEASVELNPLARTVPVHQVEERRESPDARGTSCFDLKRG